MSYTLGPYTLSAGVALPVSFPGDLGAIAYVKLANASAFTLGLTNLGPGQDYLLPMQENIWPMAGVTSAVMAIPSADISGFSAGIAKLYVTVYLAGEEPPQGSYPQSLGLLSYIGNTIMTNSSAATTIEIDLLTPFVLSGFNVSSRVTVITTGPGIALLRQADASLGRVASSGASFNLGQISATLYLDLNPDGTFSFGLTHSSQANYLTIATVTTDGSGNFASSTDTRPLGTSLLISMAGDTGVLTLAADTTAVSALTANSATLQAPPTLAHSHQETGYAAGAGVAAHNGDAWAFPINFKTVMTNVPSSITLSASSSSNCTASAPGGNITKYGFALVLTATTATSFSWVGSYTTVGN